MSADLHNDNSLSRLKKVYPQFVHTRTREDYPSAVDEDDLDVLPPIRTILYSQGLPSTEDCDETNFYRCHAVLCDPKESDTQYFINDEDLFDSDSDYFNHHGGDHGREDIEEGELSEEDMLFGSGWDSDETLTDAQFFLHICRESVHREAEEIADVALRDTVPAEDDAKYFDADDLFEREEETLVYERDGWYLEDWDL